MDDEEENTENRKPISYSTEFRLDINLNNFARKLWRGGELKCYRHTDRPSDEAGPRGAFAPKKVRKCESSLSRKK